MRARDVLLALLIVIGGIIITADRRGALGHWEEDLADAVEFPLPYSGAWAPRGGWIEAGRFTNEIDATRATTLVVDNPSGRVTVVGEKSDVVRVEVVRFGRRHSGADALADGQLPSLSLTRSGDIVSARVTSLRQFWRRGRLDLQITAPASLDLTVTAASGPVDVQGMKGNVRIEGELQHGEPILLPSLQHQAHAHRAGEDVREPGGPNCRKLALLRYHGHVVGDDVVAETDEDGDAKADG